MTVEQYHSGEPKVDHRALIKDRIRMVGEVDVSNKDPRTGFVQMLHTHFDGLGIDWDIPRTQIQINTVVASLFMASNVARYETTGQFHTDDDIATPEQSWKTMTAILENPESRNIFHEKLWQLPVTFFPERTNALYVITKHMFDGAGPLAMVDLGAGSGTALALLNQGREEAIEIACGISVDKLTREEAVLYAKANTTQERHREDIDKFIGELDLDSVTAPFVVTDLEDRVNSPGKIVSKLKEYGRDEADVVFSSFVKYQLGLGNRMHDQVRQLLGKNGIWVDIGDELFYSHFNNQQHNVHVYQKQNGVLEHIGIPFLIDEGGKILKTNQDFFRAHGKRQEVA